MPSDSAVVSNGLDGELLSATAFFLLWFIIYDGDDIPA
jgi:hypothetical protein